MSAREIDALVVTTLAELFDDPLLLLDRTGLVMPVKDLPGLERQVAVVAARVRARDHELVRDLVGQVRIRSGAVEIEVGASALAVATGAIPGHGAASTILLTAPARLTRSGMAMRLIQGGRSAAAAPARSLVRLLARGRAYWRALRKGELNITQLAEREGLSGAYVTRVLRLAFLSPASVEAILAGRQPAALNSAVLTLRSEINVEWREQAAALFAASASM